MVTFREWLWALFTPPCIHAYEKVSELRDDDNPNAGVTIIRMCKHCGETSTVEFKAPVFGCDHKWSKIDGFKKLSGTVNADGKVKHDWTGNIYTLKCDKCGEITSRTVSVR